MQLRLDSASVYEALLVQIGQWQLGDHAFDPKSDEIRISYDAGGSGRVAVTVGFELDAEEMAGLLREARPIE